jgi:hypothetical protein
VREPWDRNYQRLPELQPDIGVSELPLLVLGFEPPEEGVEILFAPGREWFYVSHQTAGVCCHHRYLYATPLRLRQEFTASVQSIADAWLSTNAGCGNKDLDEVLRYRAQLRDMLGVDCRHSFHRFQEAYYPIDPTPESIQRLAVDLVPADLDDLLLAVTTEHRTYEHPHLPSFAVWQLVTLGENSD